MTDNQSSNPNGSEDQTRPAGDWDKQYIAPPDANMGAQDATTQGRTAGSAGSHEYGGSATDSRVSDSRSNSTHHRDSGSEAGLMGSAYDTERQMQGGTPGSGANAPTSADMAGLNSSNGGATNSGSAQLGQIRQGDDRDSTIGDRADSAGHHDNPYDTVRPADESETPETMGGLDGNSSAGDALEGKSHLYTPGTTEEDYPAT